MSKVPWIQMEQRGHYLVEKNRMVEKGAGDKDVTHGINHLGPRTPMK